MRQAEITIFIILANIILLILVSGIIIFIFQYRKRKILHEKEKALIEEKHKLDILHTQLQAQEQTMQFIGREIHDSVAQKLTLATIYTQKLEYENQLPAIADKLQRISSVINDSLEELRDLSRTLADNKMHETSLADLLFFECGRVNDTGVCKAVFESDFTREISVTVKSFLLRIAQEFMQNSLKHSEGDLITVQLYQTPEGLLLKAADNGKGFDSTNVQSRGIGLANMKRRVHLIGGLFNLQSEPGKGTQLEITIPEKNLASD
jgi:signal transduction histidine kinase